jgi:type IV pilus assembly protein PilA
MLMPGGNVASGGPAAGFLIVVVMMGLLAAMAIPAFQKVRQAAQAKVCINNERQLTAALDQYRLEHPPGAKNWDDIVGPGKLIPVMPVCLLGGVYEASYDKDKGYHVTCSIPGHDPETYATTPRIPAPR